MQVSSKKISLKKQAQLLEQLLVVIADLNNPKDVSLFFTNFFSATELNVFTKRLAILRALKQGKSYEEIKDELRVSSATISSMSELANSKAMEKVIKVIERDQKISALIEKILGKNK